MSLFQKKDFISHSGEKLDFKIECDDLSDEDLETIAYIISKKFKFSGTIGVPRGGIRLEKILEKYIDETGDICLIVDDVLTTGKSMEAMRLEMQEVWDGSIIGVVIFSRTKLPRDSWIHPIFQMWE